MCALNKFPTVFLPNAFADTEHNSFRRSTSLPAFAQPKRAAALRNHGRFFASSCVTPASKLLPVSTEWPFRSSKNFPLSDPSKTPHIIPAHKQPFTSSTKPTAKNRADTADTRLHKGDINWDLDEGVGAEWSDPFPTTKVGAETNSIFFLNRTIYELFSDRFDERINICMRLYR